MGPSATAFVIGVGVGDVGVGVGVGCSKDFAKRLSMSKRLS